MWTSDYATHEKSIYLHDLPVGKHSFVCKLDFEDLVLPEYFDKYDTCVNDFDSYEFWDEYHVSDLRVLIDNEWYDVIADHYVGTNFDWFEGELPDLEEGDIISFEATVREIDRDLSSVSVSGGPYSTIVEGYHGPFTLTIYEATFFDGRRMSRSNHTIRVDDEFECFEAIKEHSFTHSYSNGLTEHSKVVGICYQTKYIDEHENIEVF